ncbi:MAG: chorismate synthase [Chloroflexota bacterium]|nr:chorismate synthase [Chloroflexota bacterium]
MNKFRFLTAGESHGKGLISIIEGMVADLPLQAEYINKELKRRQRGYGRGPRMAIEEDKAEIISGVRYGLTMGSPIALHITNRDWQNWQEQLSIAPLGGKIEPITRPRPGHADLAGVTKYGLKDIRPIIERASARETAARVAAGAVAKRFLEEFGVAINSHTVAIGQCHCERSEAISSEDSKVVNWQQVEASPVRCANVELEQAMMVAIDEAKANGDTLGGIFEVIATGVPVGLGSHVHWDRRLDGKIAQAIMSINAVKGVEIGSGFVLGALKGSEAHDVIEPSPQTLSLEGRGLGEGEAPQSLPWQHVTNRAGGIEGGMSNGEPIVVRAVVKPIATLANSLVSIDLRSGEVVKAHYERSDICVVPAAGVIAEAMLAIVLADDCLGKFGGDNLKEATENYHNYLKGSS